MRKFHSAPRSFDEIESRMISASEYLPAAISSRTLPKLALPRTLREANARLAESQTARDILDAGFVDHYVRTRDWEVRQYERAVTDWELARYFEAI